jgi:hypothetical protein
MVFVITGTEMPLTWTMVPKVTNDQIRNGAIIITAIKADFINRLTCAIRFIEDQIMYI